MSHVEIRDHLNKIFPKQYLFKTECFPVIIIISISGTCLSSGVVLADPGHFTTSLTLHALIITHLVMKSICVF